MTRERVHSGGMHATPDLKPPDHQYARWTRLVIFPLLALIVAAGFWLTNSAVPGMSDREIRGELRDAAHELIEELADDRIRPASESMARRLDLSASLREEMAGWLRAEVDPGTLTIDIETGDAPRPAGDGRASHHARLAGEEVEDARQLLLRFHHDGRPGGYRLLGYKFVDVDR